MRGVVSARIALERADEWVGERTIFPNVFNPKKVWRGIRKNRAGNIVLTNSADGGRDRTLKPHDKVVIE